MKLIWTLLLTLLSATALTSSRPAASLTAPHPPHTHNTLSTNDNRPSPAEKFIR
jgi:hypothetical protein